MSQTLGLLDLGNFMQFLFVHKDDYFLNVMIFLKFSALLIVEETNNTSKHHAESDSI